MCARLPAWPSLGKAYQAWFRCAGQAAWKGMLFPVCRVDRVLTLYIFKGQFLAWIVAVTVR